MSGAPALAAFGGYGVELEYMIVDRASLDVRPLADRLLEGTERVRGAMGWSNELALHQIEVKNVRPQPALEPLVAAFQAELAEIDARLAPFAARLMPGGMHPWMDPHHETELWAHPAEPYQTYHRIFDCHRHGWANLQSMHLNLPFAGDQEFARLHAAVRLALPLLPALAASSPYADGHYHGYMDTRMAFYRGHQRRLPASMGALIPEPAHSRANYEARVLAPMYREAAVHDPAGVLRDEWLNARAAIPRFARNAIEIRVLDAQECVAADLAIAAAVSGLVRRLYEGMTEAGAAFPTTSLARILGATIRDAERARIDDAPYLALLGAPACPCEAGPLWGHILAELDAAGRLAAPWQAPLRHIQARGPLARRLVAALGTDPPQARLEAVYRELCECLQQGRMFEA